MTRLLISDDFEEDKIQQRMEHRFLLLQNVLKHCDESDQRDYIQSESL